MEVSRTDYNFSQVLKFFGLYPVRYKNVESNGNSIRCQMNFSKSWLLNSYAIAAFMFAARIWFTFFHMKENRLSTITTTLTVVMKAHSIFVIILFIVGVIQGAGHLKADLKIIKKLNEADFKLEWFKQKKDVKVSTYWSYLGLLLHPIIVMLMDLSFIPKHANQSEGFISYYSSWGNTIYALLFAGSLGYLFVASSLMVLQYFRNISYLLKRLENTNEAFKHIIKGLKTPQWFYETHSSATKPSYIIPVRENSQNITNSYKDVSGELRSFILSTMESRLRLHEVAHIIDDFYGIALFTIVMTTGLNMIPSCYSIVFATRLEEPYHMMIVNMLILIGEIFKLLVLAEISYKVSTEASKTKGLTLNLLTSISEAGLKANVKLFIRTIDSKPIKFSGLSIFVIDRVLLINIFITIMSNLAILVQFDKH